jgi:2-oxo-4-hydroxy-4-carboxy-5-ureidoimidazoline decarboxylase
MASLSVDAASPDEARGWLRACCGSTRWVDQMLQRRPFGNIKQLLADAREVWFALEPADWKEAFAAHPKIGDRAALRNRFPGTAHLAAREQAGVDGASGDVLSALAEGNLAYEGRFGFIFIVCASGLTAEEMLQMLQARLHNDPATELRVAAEEQAKITALRLARSTG